MFIAVVSSPNGESAHSKSHPRSKFIRVRMRWFCTYLDSGYLTRGLALYDSLQQHCDSFKLWILCFDDAAFTSLSRRNLANVELITLRQLESAMEGLALTRSTRSQTEYYFTCTPALPLFILISHEDVDLITYLDADLYFYADPELLFAELGSGSIGIISHRSSSPEVNRHGIYNVGWVSFRRDRAGLTSLQWWHERCLEWCYHRVEGDKYADQKYLDSFPMRFSNVVILKHLGANLAPWNIFNYRIDLSGKQLTVDGAPLIFFHFQGFRQSNRFDYVTGLTSYSAKAQRKALRLVFEPYIRKLLEVSVTGVIAQGLVHRGLRGGSLLRRVFRAFKRFPGVLREHRNGGRLLFVSGRAW